MAPQREAALFYGLFLRGHSAETLRRDIDVPKKLLDKMMRRHRNEIAMREKLQRVYQYRKQVLAVFDEVVARERVKERVQCRQSFHRLKPVPPVAQMSGVRWL